jgi:hypothetical protein
MCPTKKDEASEWQAGGDLASFGDAERGVMSFTTRVPKGAVPFPPPCCRRLGQFDQPPSIMWIVPVVNAASSEAR